VIPASYTPSRTWWAATVAAAVFFGCARSIDEGLSGFLNQAFAVAVLSYLALLGWRWHRTRWSRGLAAASAAVDPRVRRLWDATWEAAGHTRHVESVVYRRDRKDRGGIVRPVVDRRPADPARYIAVHLDLDGRLAGIAYVLAAGFDWNGDAARARLHRQVEAVEGCTLTADWTTHHGRQVTFRPLPDLPTGRQQLRPYGNTVDAVPLGVTDAHTADARDTDGTNVATFNRKTARHIGVIGRTGGGKTVAYRVIGTGWLRGGGILACADIKQVGLAMFPRPPRRDRSRDDGGRHHHPGRRRPRRDGPPLHRDRRP